MFRASSPSLIEHEGPDEADVNAWTDDANEAAQTEEAACLLPAIEPTVADRSESPSDAVAAAESGQWKLVMLGRGGRKIREFLLPPRAHVQDAPTPMPSENADPNLSAAALCHPPSIFSSSFPYLSTTVPRPAAAAEPIKAMLVIGREKACDIRVVDPNVSAQHAYVMDGVLFDMDSTNGTFVNHCRVDQHELRLGDCITMGSACFVVELAASGSLLPPAPCLSLPSLDSPPKARTSKRSPPEGLGRVQKGWSVARARLVLPEEDEADQKTVEPPAEATRESQGEKRRKSVHQAAAEPEQPASSTPRRRHALCLVQRDAQGQAVASVALVPGQAVLIGRDASRCHIVLEDDAQAVGTHAMLVGAVVFDLDSPGVFVDGAKVSQRKLQAGERLLVGGTAFTVERAESPPESEPRTPVKEEAAQPEPKRAVRSRHKNLTSLVEAMPTTPPRQEVCPADSANPLAWHPAFASQE